MLHAVAVAVVVVGGLRRGGDLVASDIGARTELDLLVVGVVGDRRVHRRLTAGIVDEHLVASVVVGGKAGREPVRVRDEVNVARIAAARIGGLGTVRRVDTQPRALSRAVAVGVVVVVARPASLDDRAEAVDAVVAVGLSERGGQPGSFEGLRDDIAAVARRAVGEAQAEEVARHVTVRIVTLSEADADRLEPRIEARLFLRAVGVGEQPRRAVRRVGVRRGVVFHRLGPDLSGGVGDAPGSVVIVGQHAARGVSLLLQGVVPLVLVGEGVGAVDPLGIGSNLFAGSDTAQRVIHGEVGRRDRRAGAGQAADGKWDGGGRRGTGRKSNRRSSL